LNEINNTKTIGAVIKAVEVLRLLSTSETELGVTEISNKLSYGVSATYHLLNTLKLCNIIEQDKETKKYRIGFELFRISSVAKNQNNLANIAQQHLDKLKESVGETSNLVVLDGNCIVYIAQSESTNLLKMFTQLGAKVPFYCTGGGKAILAYQSEDVQKYTIIKTAFNKYTKNTLTTTEELINEFKIIRIQGYALDNEERELGVTCIAAPVFDCYGEAIAAISISGPSSRLNGKGIKNLIHHVMNASDNLSFDLGYVKE
jgi:IclR family KDG regulon transcriptional repressor